MKITTIAEHSVCLDELRSPANILDLGCRGFDFTNYFDKRGDFVIPVDIDLLPNTRPYVRVAISNYIGTCGIKRSKDAQAMAMSRIITDEVVNCTTLEALSKDAGISYWDLIKCDIEGSEYEVIMSLTKAPSKQWSFETHLHTGAYGMAEVKLMEEKLKSLGYAPVKHELTKAHGLPENYWDSLWVR